MTMQHPEPHDLTALAYDLLEGPEREQLLTHLSRCDTCRATYDSFREEQALVRDAIVRDARSGPAEARALERTLVMLGAQSETVAKPQAKLIALPAWVWAAQAAAIVVVALTLFFVFRPVEPEFLPVAENRRGADVRSGTALVVDNGVWKPAEAVPYDTWTKAGNELTIELPDGGQATLAADSVFSIALDATVNAPVLTVLAGRGEVHADAKQLLVRTGDARIHMLPGGRLLITVEGDAGDAAALRSWSMPRDARTQVKQGDALVVPASRRYGSIALRDGESLRWTPQDIEARDADGKVVKLALAAVQSANEDDMRRLQVQLGELKLRLDHLAERHDLHREKWFEELFQSHSGGGAFQVKINVEGAGLVSSVALALGEIGVAAWTTEFELGFEITRDHSRLRFTETTPEGLRKMVPGAEHELFELVKFEREGKQYKALKDSTRIAEYCRKHNLPQPR